MLLLRRPRRCVALTAICVRGTPLPHTRTSARSRRSRSRRHTESPRHRRSLCAHHHHHHHLGPRILTPARDAAAPVPVVVALLMHISHASAAVSAASAAAHYNDDGRDDDLGTCRAALYSLDRCCSTRAVAAAVVCTLLLTRPNASAAALLPVAVMRCGNDGSHGRRRASRSTAMRRHARGHTGPDTPDAR